MTTHWVMLVSLPFGGGALTGVIKLGPRIARRLLATLDCEADRARWEDRDRRRDREIASLRLEMDQVQDDLDRVLKRAGVDFDASSAASGVDSVTVPPSVGRMTSAIQPPTTSAT